MNKEIEIPEGYEARIEGNKVIFEPKKSEDERIRKEIIDYFYGCIKRNKKSGFRVEQIKGWIVYLEKQKDILGERAKNITSNMLENGIGGIQRELIEFLSNTVNASWVDVIKSADAYVERIRNIIEKQKEQKPSTEETELNSIAFLEQMGYTCIPPKEQKPAEWSEEDLQHESWILECLADGKRTMPQYAADFHAAYNWLKSLRPSWKPSNLELGALRTAISVLTEERNFQMAGKHLQDILDHFEGKETRHDWKPSELQMFALDSAILMFHNLKRGGDKEELQSLYNDLERLRKGEGV